MKTYDPLDPPDRDLDPPEYDYEKCEECGADIPPTSISWCYCDPCFEERKRERDRKEMSDTLKDIGRSLDKLGQLPMMRRQAE